MDEHGIDIITVCLLVEGGVDNIILVSDVLFVLAFLIQRVLDGADSFDEVRWVD